MNLENVAAVFGAGQASFLSNGTTTGDHIISQCIGSRKTLA